MSSTNKTTNYELSQFVGSDKPAWLADYNSDMSKIDTAIKGASNTAVGADGKADANTTNIGDLSYLSTTAKNNLVASINEVDTKTETAQQTANTASTNANLALTGVNKLNLTNFGTTTASATNATLSSTANTLSYASNSDGSVGKIYGRIVATSTNNNDIVITMSTPFRPDSNITIDGVMFSINQNSSDKLIYPFIRTFSVNGDGTLTVSIPNSTSGQIYRLFSFACLIFFKDFGDTPANA